MSVRGTHCCKHHCKYAEDNCPVVLGQETGVVDTIDCNECRAEIIIQGYLASKDESGFEIEESDFSFHLLNQGFRLYWSEKFGEYRAIDFSYNKQANRWFVNTENMGKDFVMKVFEHFLFNKCELTE